MQTRLGSLLEVVVNTVLGLAIAMVATNWICAAYGIPMSLNSNFILTSWMTVVSIARSYLLRRLFNGAGAAWCCAQLARVRLALFKHKRRAAMAQRDTQPPMHLTCGCGHTPLPNERDSE